MPLDPYPRRAFPRIEEYIEEFYCLRQRKRVTRTEAAQLVRHPVRFGTLMLRLGHADGLI